MAENELLSRQEFFRRGCLRDFELGGIETRQLRNLLLGGLDAVLSPTWLLASVRRDRGTWTSESAQPNSMPGSTYECSSGGAQKRRLRVHDSIELSRNESLQANQPTSSMVYEDEQDSSVIVLSYLSSDS